MSIFRKLRLSCIMVVLSLVFSIISLCRTFPRDCESSGFDYIGVIVAVFSILVTILVGWNIYTALEIGKDMKMIKNEYTKIKEEQTKIKKDLNALDEKVNDVYYYCKGTVFFIQGLIFFNSRSEKIEYFYIIHYFLRAIEQFTMNKTRQYDELDAIDVSIKNIEIAIKKLKKKSEDNAFDKIGSRDYDTDFKDYIVRFKKTGFMTNVQLENLTTFIDELYLIIEKYLKWKKEIEENGTNNG